MKDYIKAVQLEFAEYGFAACPLTSEMISYLYERSISVDQAYGIGCDINSGFTFNQCVEDL